MLNDRQPQGPKSSDIEKFTLSDQAEEVGQFASDHGYH